jgi:hypothetical protein
MLSVALASRGQRLFICVLEFFEPSQSMRCSLIVFFACILCSAHAEAQDYRVFKNIQGFEIRARLLGVEDGMATIIREDGTQFTVAVSTFSAEDQQFITDAAAAMASGFITKASANDNLSADELNTLIGAPIFGETVLWDSNAAAVASKLDLRSESKTREQSSFRSYPREEYRLFGARPYSVALYAEDSRPVHLSMVFANKGDLFGARGSAAEHFEKDAPPKDAYKILAAEMKKDIDTIATTLSGKLGQPVKQRFGEGTARRNVYRWDWRGHAILLSDVPEEYVGIEVATQAFADSGGRVARLRDDVIRARAAANLQKGENGDVVIDDIPMVDQGPKGYCVPATAERVMRYLGVPADMYVLAMAGDTNFGGGTSVNALLEGVGRDIKRKGRSFDKWNGPMKIKDLAKYIDKGIPVMWTMYSTKAWNKTADKRTRKRREITDWSEWKAAMTEVSKNASLVKDDQRGHVVLIIGYNADTGEIAFSDSWGERFKERWMTLVEAEQISQSSFYVVGF